MCDARWRIKAPLRSLQHHSLNSFRCLTSKMPSLSIIRRISDFPAAAESTILAIDDTLKYCQGNLADESYVSALVNAISDLKAWVFRFHFRVVADISLLGRSRTTR